MEWGGAKIRRERVEPDGGLEARWQSEVLDKWERFKRKGKDRLWDTEVGPEV